MTVLKSRGSLSRKLYSIASPVSIIKEYISSVVESVRDIDRDGTLDILHCSLMNTPGWQTYLCSSSHVIRVYLYSILS